MRCLNTSESKQLAKTIPPPIFFLLAVAKFRDLAAPLSLLMLHEQSGRRVFVVFSHRELLFYLFSRTTVVEPASTVTHLVWFLHVFLATGKLFVGYVLLLYRHASVEEIFTYFTLYFRRVTFRIRLVLLGVRGCFVLVIFGLVLTPVLAFIGVVVLLV